MDTLLQDLRYAVRTLLRAPGFTLVAALTLGLGIGVNTTMFSVVDAILLRPFPNLRTDGLVLLRTSHLKTGGESSVSYPNFVDWRDNSRAFSGMAAYHDESRIVTGRGGDPEEVQMEAVSPGLFEVLGVRPVLGRTFLPEEGERGRDGVVILTDREWERRFGRDPGVLGTTLTMDGVPHTVVGVMPEGFGFPDNQRMWVPMTAPASPNRGGNYLSVVARLKPGVSLEAARAELGRLGAELAERYPDSNAGNGIAAFDFREHWSGEVAAAIWVMMGAVGLVLLIACANVASLLLARAATRRREVAVRVAMGASRARLVRQLLTESTLLALLGGGLGVLLAAWGLRAILASFPFEPPYWMVFDLDPGVLAFVLAVSLGTGIVFGLAPALRATAGALQGTLRDGGRGATAGARDGRLHRGLVAAELALSVVLLVGALLMIRSFLHLNAADPGFRAEGAVTVRVTAGGPRYEDPAARAALYRRALDEARAVPGVSEAGVVDYLPLSGNMSTSTYDVDRRDLPRAERPSAQVRRASEGFVEAMGIPLLAGRGITAEEARSGAPVAVVSRTLAERTWPGEDAVGREINVGGPWRRVVGVVGDVSSRYRGDEARPQVYLPSSETPGGSAALVVRTAGDPAAVVPALRQALRAVDPSLPMADAATLEDVASRSLWQQRLFGGMFTSFGMVALLMAVAGVYAMMAYAVAQRVHEIGVRMALGAQARQVLAMVVGQGLRLAGIGVAAGLLGAWGLTRLMAGLLVGVSPTDPATFVAIAVLLAGVALLAAWLPARRATRVDPMQALRAE